MSATETAAVLTGVLNFLLIYGYLLNYFPKEESYRIETKKFSGNKKIILLADLHGNEHGRENQKLLRMIEKNQPDFICIAGDMVVKKPRRKHFIYRKNFSRKNSLYKKRATHSEKSADRAVRLIEALAERYPVYYAPGNHEIRLADYDGYRERVRRAGAVYLENDSVSLGENIRVAGLDLPKYWYHKAWERRNMTAEDMTGWLGTCDESCYTILLAHDPEYFPKYADWGADLTLSGHVHGGIARLPVLGGVLAPSLRLFPPYDAGFFSRQGRGMVVSRGLGLHHIKLRFFNRPELSVITIVGTQSEDKG